MNASPYLVCFGLFLLISPPAIGKFREVFPLPQTTINQLRASLSLEGNLASELEAEAGSRLGEEFEPNPVEVIHFQGLLDNNPLRIETNKSLIECRDIAYAYTAFTASEEEPFKDEMMDAIVAWARLYKPTGDPINENKLTPLLCAYITLRTQFEPDMQQLVDDWIRRMLAAHDTAYSPQNNWLAKRLLIYAYGAIILEDPDYAKKAVDGYQSLAAHMLLPDGRSLEIEHRDAISYHCGLLRPMLQIAITVHNYPEVFGEYDLYRLPTPSGATLQKSVDFLLPYATGEKVYHQWTNSKVALDHKRAEAGLTKYQKGTPFDPQKALPILVLASFFDTEHVALVEEMLNQATPANRLAWQWIIQTGQVAGARP